MCACGLRGLGWHRDLPDARDYAPGDPQVKKLWRKIPTHRRGPKEGPRQVDLRQYFPQVYDQQDLNACTAHACVALVEYFERRSFGNTTRLSQLYLYRNARRLLGTTADIGADLRTSLRAMVRFGIPPENQWPYKAENFHKEPDPFLQAYADKYRRITYLRLDRRNGSGRETLNTARRFLAAGFPLLFGFPVPTSTSDDADIPYRPTFDSFLGGQAVVAVGYDDERIQAHKGALLVRNSWGTGWGDKGYGWLPYAFVKQQLATDFWTLLRADWLSSGEFERPLFKKRARSHEAADVDQQGQKPR